MKTVRFGLIGCGLMGREFASAAARWKDIVPTSIHRKMGNYKHEPRSAMESRTSVDWS